MRQAALCIFRRADAFLVAEIKDPGPIFWILVGAAIVIVIIVAAKH